MAGRTQVHVTSIMSRVYRDNRVSVATHFGQEYKERLGINTNKIRFVKLSSRAVSRHRYHSNVWAAGFREEEEEEAGEQERRARAVVLSSAFRIQFCIFIFFRGQCTAFFFQLNILRILRNGLILWCNLWVWLTERFDHLVLLRGTIDNGTKYF